MRGWGRRGDERADNGGTDHVLRWFGDYKQPDFARSGFKATKTVELKEGKFRGEGGGLWEPTHE